MGGILILPSVSLFDEFGAGLKGSSSAESVLVLGGLRDEGGNEGRLTLLLLSVFLCRCCGSSSSSSSPGNVDDVDAPAGLGMEVARWDGCCSSPALGGEGANQDASADAIPLPLPLLPSLLLSIFLLTCCSSSSSPSFITIFIDDNVSTRAEDDDDDAVVVVVVTFEHIPCEPSRIGRCIYSIQYGPA